MTTNSITDIFVVGGGINGCAIARDAAGRGYSVVLAEMDDLASGTSSAATKLIHGGLRYLEYYEFRLVREALAEREILWRMAPHLIRPLRFVLPHHDGLRPAWLLRLGLFIYDHIGTRKLLPPTAMLDLRGTTLGLPLKAAYARAFEFSDCWADDARLVVLTARDAADRGATIRTRTRVVSARRDGGLWTVALQCRDGQPCPPVRARVLINAAGPWVDDVLREALGRKDAHNVRLVKGSHIVVKRLFAHDRAYFFQNGDGRVIFAIPYEGEFTLIGTTDRDFSGDPRGIAIADDEIAYLLAAAGEYFDRPLGAGDVVWSYSGVRPLFNDHKTEAQAATRDYVLHVESPEGEGALINIFGGKLTTHRRLAEAAMGKVGKAIGARGTPWTHESTLPGGEFHCQDFEGEVERLNRRYPHFPDRLLHKMARRYGRRMEQILGDAQRPSDLGEHFGADLRAREVDYLMAEEWAQSTDDILWRRTKLGLHIDAAGRARLEAYIAAKIGGGSP